MSEPFKLNKASESFLDWIDGGGVPMPDTRYDTAMMLRKIEQKAGADADAQRREREAVLYRVIADSEADRLALREALFAIFRAERWTDQDDFMPWLGRVLSNTAATAQAYEARIRADAVKPWRQWVYDVIGLLLVHSDVLTGDDSRFAIETGRALLDAEANPTRDFHDWVNSLDADKASEGEK